MKRSMKKVLATVLAAASMLSMNMVTASAINWTAPCTQQTAKTSTASLYVRNSGTVSCYLNVKAVTGNNVIKDVSTYNGKTLQTTNLTIPASQTRTVKQFVYELGYRTVQVHFWKSPPGGAEAKGTWLADTPAYYPPVN